MTQRILVVDDEVSVLKTVRAYLEQEGFNVASAADSQTALELARTFQPDLVILDVMLTGMDGFSVLRELRRESEVYVLMLTARAGEVDRVVGLELGADDYLTKPFELEELLLRVNNLLQKGKAIRGASGTADRFSFGGHQIDFRSQIARLKSGEEVELSKKEAMLLQLLVNHPNEVVTREKILQTVWGYQVYPTTRTIDNFILAFRKHFEEDNRNPRYFHSVRGLGYKFTP